jgi:signal recognition particle subunit SRP54
MGDVKKLVNVLKESITDEDQLKSYQKLKKGEFTLGDMRAQYQTVNKMGSVNSIMSMIPGMSSQMMGEGSEQANVNKVKKSICIIDSMTQDELDGKVTLSESRITRVARGSGVTVQKVTQLIDEYKRMK